MSNSSKGYSPHMSLPSLPTTPTPSSRRTIGPRAPKSTPIPPFHSLPSPSVPTPPTFSHPTSHPKSSTSLHELPEKREENLTAPTRLPHLNSPFSILHDKELISSSASDNHLTTNDEEKANLLNPPEAQSSSQLLKTPENSANLPPLPDQVPLSANSSSSSLNKSTSTKHLRGPRQPFSSKGLPTPEQLPPIPHSSESLPTPPTHVDSSKPKRKKKYSLPPVVEVPEITNELSPKYSNDTSGQVYRLRTVRSGSPNSTSSIQFEIPSTRPPSLDQLLHLFNDFLRHPMFDFDDHAIALLQTCTPDEKWNFIRANFSGFDDPSFQIPELAAVHRPVSWFVLQLWNKTISNLQLITLSSLLTTQSNRWVSLFLELQGLRAIHNLLTYFNSSTVVQSQQAELLRCVFQLMRKRATLATSDSYIFSSVTQALGSTNLLPRKVTADILSWACDLKESSVILTIEDGLKNLNPSDLKNPPLCYGFVTIFKVTVIEKEISRTPPSSPSKIAITSSPSNIAFLEYCTSTMDFINHYVSVYDDLSSSEFDVLECLQDSGIHEVIQHLRNFPDKQLERQLNIYESEEERRAELLTPLEDGDSFLSHESSILSNINEVANNELGSLLESTIQSILLTKANEKQKLKLVKIFNSLLQKFLLNSKISDVSFEESLQVAINSLTNRLYSDETARNALQEAKASRAMAEKMVIERDAMAAQVNLGVEDLIEKLKSELNDQNDVILSQKRSNETLRKEVEDLQKSHLAQIQRSELELRELYLLFNHESNKLYPGIGRNKIVEYLDDKLELRKKEITAESVFWSSDGISEKLKSLREQMNNLSTQDNSTGSSILQIPDKDFVRPFPRAKVPRNRSMANRRSASESFSRFLVHENIQAEKINSPSSLNGISHLNDTETTYKKSKGISDSMPKVPLDSDSTLYVSENEQLEEKKRENLNNENNLSKAPMPKPLLAAPPPPPPLPMKTSMDSFLPPPISETIQHTAPPVPGLPPPPPPPPPVLSCSGAKFLNTHEHNEASKALDLNEINGMERPKRRLKQMHWEKLDSGLEYTFWSATSSQSNSLYEKLKNANIFEQIEENFAMKEAKPLQKKGTQRTEYMSSDLQKLFGIHFHKLSHKNPDEIIRMVLHCDESVAEATEFLGSEKILNQTKLKADLEPYRIDWTNGGEPVNAEKDSSELSRWDYLYLRLIVDLQNYWGKRVNALKIKYTIDTNYETLVRQAKLIGRAALILRDNDMFKCLMRLILCLGNYMNDYVRQARGFSLSSLQRLPLIKNSTNTKSLLQVLEIIVRKNFPTMEEFLTDFSVVTEAAKLNIETVEQECTELIRGCQNLQLDCDSGVLSDPTSFHPDDKILTVIIPWLNEGAKKMDFLKEHLRTMNTTLNNAMRYFAEQPSDLNARNVFFKKISSFIADYKRAKAENMKAEEQSSLKENVYIKKGKSKVLELALSEKDANENREMDTFLNRLRDIKLDGHNRPHRRLPMNDNKENPKASIVRSSHENQLSVPKRDSQNIESNTTSPRLPKTWVKNMERDRRIKSQGQNKRSEHHTKKKSKLSRRIVSDTSVIREKDSAGKENFTQLRNPTKSTTATKAGKDIGNRRRKSSRKLTSVNKEKNVSSEPAKFMENKPIRERLVDKENEGNEYKQSANDRITPTNIGNSDFLRRLSGSSNGAETASALQKHQSSFTEYGTTSFSTPEKGKQGDINTILRRSSSRGSARRRLLDQMNSPLAHKSLNENNLSDIGFQTPSKSSYTERLERLKSESVQTPNQLRNIESTRFELPSSSSTLSPVHVSPSPNKSIRAQEMLAGLLTGKLASRENLIDGK
ncbi:formin Cdc12 [Schizosaccharomyces cryophilus OY26]|uniref:Formin Cdc12 n=1 Tax=Schizosaccharomyces cryophilus (strain OY26 / ATCC MYA-4695 / CBS 11777 / NBRC 106824 / NRRL Y48691) TaxID=653667 RepID=S9W3Y3_SCHCR|nr:formin Cdc12 [Schizosaccharomyces cryophilus OY26]EPY52660.1 formin Cdc12 [Schizosaccharomyces cryophilus OY26]